MDLFVNCNDRLAKEKFEELTSNEEYLFDCDKNTKDEVVAIKKLLDKFNNNKLDSLLYEELYEESKTFAMKVQNALDKKIGNETLNRGVKENIYFVVKNSFIPAVLVEVGFLYNKSEANQLTNEAYLNKLATGIVNGIGDFINEYEKYNDKK